MSQLYKGGVSLAGHAGLLGKILALLWWFLAISRKVHLTRSLVWDQDMVRSNPVTSFSSSIWYWPLMMNIPINSHIWAVRGQFLVYDIFRWCLVCIRMSSQKGRGLVPLWYNWISADTFTFHPAAFGQFWAGHRRHHFDLTHNNCKKPETFSFLLIFLPCCVAADGFVSVDINRDSRLKLILFPGEPTCS